MKHTVRDGLDLGREHEVAGASGEVTQHHGKG